MSIFEASGGGTTIRKLLYTGPTASDTIGTIQCSTLDGGTTGIRVAMPWLLRSASYDSKTIGGNIYTFTSSFVRDADPTPAGGGDNWTENIFMPYNVGDVITVIPNDGTVSDISAIATIPYVEVSNNRIWGESC